MALGFDFRNELYGPWEIASGYLVETFDRLFAGLSTINPLLSLATLPASSVLITGADGVPSFGTILPQGLAFGSSGAGISRADGSQIIPAAYNTQALSYPSANRNQLAHSFVVNTNIDIPGSSSQVIEGYNFYSASGTTPIIISLVGNSEAGGTGTITSQRSCQAGITITNTGGGTDATCFFAAPSGRAFGGSGTFTNGYGVKVSSFGAGYTNHYALHCADTTAGIFLTSDIAAKSSTNTWQVTSDRRVKRDVTAFVGGLDLLERLNPVHYTYNGVGDTIDGVEGIGLIAQEAQAVAPTLVKSRNASDGDTYLTVDSGDVTWMLVNAVKDLSARVKELEAR